MEKSMVALAPKSAIQNCPLPKWPHEIVSRIRTHGAQAVGLAISALILSSHQPAAAGGTVCAAIQATQRAQLAEEPGVRLPRRRAPVAPVAEVTLAGSPSTVKAASTPQARALRVSAGMPAWSVLSSGTPGS